MLKRYRKNGNLADFSAVASSIEHSSHFISPSQHFQKQKHILIRLITKLAYVIHHGQLTTTVHLNLAYLDGNIPFFCSIV